MPSPPFFFQDATRTIYRQRHCRLFPHGRTDTERLKIPMDPGAVRPALFGSDSFQRAIPPAGVSTNVLRLLHHLPFFTRDNCGASPAGVGYSGG
jgi:hypothetical protein